MDLNKLRGQHKMEVKVHTQESGQTRVRLLALPTQRCKRYLPVSQIPHYNHDYITIPYMLIMRIK